LKLMGNSGYEKGEDGNNKLIGKILLNNLLKI
jgi:hypothetical protein